MGRQRGQRDKSPRATVSFGERRSVGRAITAADRFRPLALNISIVVNAFRPVALLLLGNSQRDFPKVRDCHPCLSACCGVVTAERIKRLEEAGDVTNAFRPVVVLLHQGG